MRKQIALSCRIFNNIARQALSGTENIEVQSTQTLEARLLRNIDLPVSDATRSLSGSKRTGEAQRQLKGIRDLCQTALRSVRMAMTK